MIKENCKRKGCKDVFNAFLFKMAVYAGFFEIPCIKPINDIPNKLIPFSKALKCTDYNQWIHFYEDDYLFERVWRYPRRYLNILKRYNGVILPDFSVYRDMPLIMQMWNIFRSRALGHWLQMNGVKVIPNIRFGDDRTYCLSCDGIAKNAVIAVGTNGTMKNPIDRIIFLNGLDYAVKRLKPKTIIVYGAAHDKYFKKYKDMGINIVQFDCESKIKHKK